jgi:hypothetical protein
VEPVNWPGVTSGHLWSRRDLPGEQAIRPGVVNRKTSGGRRSDRGADAQGVLTSVFRSARQQGR